MQFLAITLFFLISCKSDKLFGADSKTVYWDKAAS